MADAIANVLAHHNLREAFDLLAVDDLTETDPGSLGLGEHLAVFSLDTCGANSQTWKIRVYFRESNIACHIVETGDFVVSCRWYKKD